MTSYKTLDISAICSRLCSAERILILCHTNPDADCLGSALAMREICLALGKEAKITSPMAPPRRLRFMTGDETFEYSTGEEKSFDLVISVDVAAPMQLGTLEFLKDSVGLMIDHHLKGEVFADNLVDKNAAACGEIIFEIYEHLCKSGKTAPSPKTCTYLFAALSADTGSFKYSNTTPKTLRIGASLMEEINSSDEKHTDEISRLLHDTDTLLDMKINSFVTSALKFFEDGSLALCMITTDDMEKSGFTGGDLGGAVDIGRRVENVLVSAVLKQQADDPSKFRISARANCDIDVSAVCALFGGGGHTRAAGATLTAESPKAAFDTAEKAFCAAVTAYKTREASK